jgi:O-antigen ligase
MAGLLLGALTMDKSCSPPRRGFSLLVFLSSIGGLGASLTRGAWLGFIGGLVTLSLALSRKVKLIMLVLAVILAVAGVSLSSTLHQRFASITDPQNHSNHTRVIVWQATWEMFKDHPWLGVGLHRNRDYLLEYYKVIGHEEETFISHSHSDYLEQLAGTGVFGFLAFITFSLWFLREAYRLWRRSPAKSFEASLGLGALAALIFFHIGSFTQCNFTDAEVAHMLVFIWALVVSRSKSKSFSPD